ncbi:hypothetical protein M513_05392 [Trichuris suis]|uniref:Uncharacterized protein n=1 Tax=Trichuris suis TaxID=68888 RepID=A0A085M8Z1_9BILA|nr:hypothetical protein M513_05392 [Trichuris suis]
MMAPIHEQSENMIWERAVPNATALEQHSPQELDTVIQQQVVPSKDPKPLSKNAEPSSPSETVESREKATRPHMFTWAIPNYTVAAEPTKKVQDGKKKEAADLLLSTEVDSPPNKSGGGSPMNTAGFFQQCNLFTNHKEIKRSTRLTKLDVNAQLKQGHTLQCTFDLFGISALRDFDPCGISTLLDFDPCGISTFRDFDCRDFDLSGLRLSGF